MREIKFRAWDGEKKVMLYPTSISWRSNSHRTSMCFVHNEGEPYDENGERSLIPSIIEDGFPLMQYTGLKDKNGKEIYEWDVVESSIESQFASTFMATTLCDYDEVGAQFVLRAKDGKHWTEIPRNCEVIGNIYENPELLNDVAQVKH